MNFSIFQLQAAVDVMRQNLPTVLGMIAILWLIHSINWASFFYLNRFGILPRTGRGLFGILFSPFLHGNFNHLFFNTIPLLVLTNFMFIRGWPQFLCSTGMIIILGGLGVWFIGRRAIHIGASGLIMGYWAYCLILAYYQPSLLSIVVAGVCIYYFGGLALSIIPQEAKTSWEGHLCGFVAGLVAVYLCPWLGTCTQ